MADIQKVTQLGEAPKLAVKEKGKTIPSVRVAKFDNVKEAQEKKEDGDIKNDGNLPSKDFVINLAEKIINQQKHNKLTRDLDKIYIDFYTLGIEDNQNNVAKLIYYFKIFKQFGGIEDYKFDDVRIIINKPNIKKLQTYIKDFNDLDEVFLNNKGGDERRVSYIYRKSGNSSFFFLGYKEFNLEGRRADITQFFYTNSKIWKTYEEIKDEIINFDSEAIKNAIKAINKRFSEHTGNKFKELIESREVKNGKRKSHEYRWKF